MKTITNDIASTVNNAPVRMLDALWALISAQPKKVKKTLASRLLVDLSKESRNTTRQLINSELYQII